MTILDKKKTEGCTTRWFLEKLNEGCQRVWFNMSSRAKLCFLQGFEWRYVKISITGGRNLKIVDKNSGEGI